MYTIKFHSSGRLEPVTITQKDRTNHELVISELKQAYEANVTIFAVDDADTRHNGKIWVNLKLVTDIRFYGDSIEEKEVTE